VNIEKFFFATNGSTATGSSDIEGESLASNEDGGGDENGMDDEEDKDAEGVEEGVNHPIVPPIIPSNLLHSLDSAKDNNDEGGINYSFPSNDDEDCQGPFDAAAMPSSQACGGSKK
jgi:hypothetical protein